jgi:hypothetical protein
MVNTDPDEKQRTFNEFEENQSEACLDCLTCGIERGNKDDAKQCCQAEQVDPDRAGVITSPDDPHVGFALPPHVSDGWRELIHRVRDAIAAAETENPLPAAVDVLQNHLPAGTDEDVLKNIFVHLVYLQQIQELPGYPVKARTGDSDLPTIREYCNDRDDLTGYISKSSVGESEGVSVDPLARFTPLTVGSTFIPRLNANVDGSVYEWDTVVQLVEGFSGFQTNNIFNEGTAHNAMTIEARDQLLNYSNVDMVTAPYRIGTGTFEIEAATEVRALTEAHEEEPPIQPAYTFDFAGLSDETSPKLEVLGMVIGEYDKQALARLAISTKTDATRLIVAPTRTVLQEFIADLLGDYTFQDAPDPDKAVAYYNKQPSLDAAIKEIKSDIGFDSSTAFTTFRKLLDESRTPTDVLDDMLSEGEE